ncbi:MAG: hypothetical protein ABSF77_14980 [Spirochaetia bacterium]|jgi:hypothetical protein
MAAVKKFTFPLLCMQMDLVTAWRRDAISNGADAKVKSKSGSTAFDFAQDNEKLKGTDAYRQLQKASQ